MADFNALLQQAQKLRNETQRSSDLPRVDRTLPQVLQATNELHSRITQTGAQDIQAHIFLGSKGIDLPKISQKLETLSARKTFETLDPIADTDIQSFLRNEKENAILSVIEEVHKNSYKTAQQQKWDNVMSDWKREKIVLMNALVGPSQNWLDLQKTPEQTILNEVVANRRSNLSHQEINYAREVIEYNKIVISGALRPSLVQKFAQVAQAFNDTKVNEMWEVVKYMVNVEPVSRSQDPIKSRTEMRCFVDQAKKYLENRYKLYMSTIVSDHLREAQRGGIPSIFKLVCAYVSLKFADQNTSFLGLQDGYIEGRPLWPMVYYCLRCGDLKSALNCMSMAGPGHAEFIKLLEDKNNKTDPKLYRTSEIHIKAQYKRQIHNSTDPYKRAAYCILACCDIHEQHTEVAKTSDDFLWIQLCLIRDEDNDNSECFTYRQLQTMILEKYGEKHYNAAEQPHLYFQVLMLTGQFEAALEFLSRTERYRTHAVHMALALNEMFLIGGPRNVQQPLLSVDIDDPSPARRLNIARLVMLYVKRFEITDPSEAINYYFFLRNLRDPEGQDLFLVSVADLAIECRNYDLIFGKMQHNGMRTKGLIDDFESMNMDVGMACRIVAEELVTRGQYEDAVRLFDLSNNYEQSLRYMSIMLSQVVHQESKKDSLRERLQLFSNDIYTRYSSENVKCDPQIFATFVLLRTLLKFFDEYHGKNYQQALETLATTKIVPMNLLEVDECVQTFKRLNSEVCKIFPDILLATMEILHAQYKNLKGRDPACFIDANKERQLNYIRERAKAITNMAATIPFRMPGDINSHLVQTEILMH